MKKSMLAAGIVAVIAIGVLILWLGMGSREKIDPRDVLSLGSRRIVLVGPAGFTRIDGLDPTIDAFLKENEQKSGGRFSSSKAAPRYAAIYSKGDLASYKDNAQIWSLFQGIPFSGSISYAPTFVENGISDEEFSEIKRNVVRVAAGMDYLSPANSGVLEEGPGYFIAGAYSITNIGFKSRDRNKRYLYTVVAFVRVQKTLIMLQYYVPGGEEHETAARTLMRGWLQAFRDRNPK